ncbi:hypothetical protein, partial [Intestinimonas butyriciproducens]|uniref:hypothetical protein n=1 Tax=Intestinimonas butyriciproducens TaxID=1297617 RepID=UPI001959D8B7
SIAKMAMCRLQRHGHEITACGPERPTCAKTSCAPAFVCFRGAAPWAHEVSCPLLLKWEKMKILFEIQTKILDKFLWSG